MRLSGMNKGDELTVTTDEVSRSGNIQSKATKYVTELKVVLKQTLNTEASCLFSVWLASFRWHELYSGLITELGKLHINAKGNTQWEHPRGRIPMLYAETD